MADKITFSEYRSQCLKILWKEELDLFGMDSRAIIENPNFSTWRVDDICAENWKKNRLFLECVADLTGYIKEEVL